jgi:hypothetical protein
MGWASGSRVATELWDVVRSSIDPGERIVVARRFIAVFEKYDADTVRDECETLMSDADLYEGEV